MTLPFSLAIRPSVPGIIFPPLPSSDVATFMNLYFQLEHTQWLSPDKLQELQFQQLASVVDHARNTVPYYQAKFDSIPSSAYKNLNPEVWQTFPILTRRDIQDAGKALASSAVPRHHGTAHTARTSGSTGQPVEVLRSGYDQLMWQALTLRDHCWHRREMKGKFCAIRAGAPQGPDGISQDGWGGVTGRLFQTGPSAALSIGTDISVQADWLRHHAPDYLLTYPSNLAALLEHFQRKGETLPVVKGIQTVGEILPEWLRTACREQIGISPVDIYSSQEVGNVALQCPESGLYHIHSESLLVEVLDEQGRQCKPGETGRIVVSTLHGFAMPLLRYEMGDFAQVGPLCPCGRGLPTLFRIHGRVRNMVTMPNGEKRWPLVGFSEYRKIAPSIRQYQFLQTSLDSIEIRLVVDKILSKCEEEAMTTCVTNYLGYDYNICFSYTIGFGSKMNYVKFEEFVSNIIQ